jgi:Putative polyhydroxyalkanoic acid system protein (PHA_gran_rgn)
VLPRVDAEANDGLFPQGLGSLQPMQAFDKHKACAVRPHQDWRLLAVGEHTVRYLLDAFGIKRGPSPDWHVDGVDRESLAFHHDAERVAQVPTVILSSVTFSCVVAVPTCPEAPGRSPAMSEPLVVLLPHRLGKDEALRRIKDGLGRAKGEFAWLLSIDQDVWTGDRLSFRASALGQTATGFIDVYEANVRVEVTLPWLLARFAHAAQRVIGQKGQLMLEKK